LGGEPFFEGLLESLGLALGLGVVRPAVFLLHAEAAQLVLQAVAAALAAGEPGSEDHPVIGERGGGDAVLGAGGAERGEDDRAGH